MENIHLLFVSYLFPPIQFIFLIETVTSLVQYLKEYMSKKLIESLKFSRFSNKGNHSDHIGWVTTDS